MSSASFECQTDPIPELDPDYFKQRTKEIRKDYEAQIAEAKAKYEGIFHRHKQELTHFNSCDKIELMMDINTIKEIAAHNRKITKQLNPSHVFAPNNDGISVGETRIPVQFFEDDLYEQISPDVRELLNLKLVSIRRSFQKLVDS